MRVFVTGGTGFAGIQLIDRLLVAGHDITAFVHAATSLVEVPPTVTVVAGDLRDATAVNEAISEAGPEVIFHLAGQASPGRSWQIPAQTFAVNTMGTVNVLEAARAHGRPRVVVVTSADVYGVIGAADLPITEATAVHPRHPYGVSKAAAAQLVGLYWERYGLPVVEARPFNHIGPGQALGFVLPDFASQLADIQWQRRAPILRVGNLRAERDFTDVRDVVRAYEMLAHSGRPGEAYLICSGRPVAVTDLLSTLIEVSGLEVTIETDPEKMRASDVPCLYASHAKLTTDTGWQPQISLQQSVADTFADWLSRHH